MSGVLSIADEINKLQAFCAVCQAPATETQRIIDGEYAKENDTVVVIGADEQYEPRCRKCHVIQKEGL